MKGPQTEQHDGSGLRIGIAHARWNAEIIGPLLEGTKAKLRACGVREANIVVESVPGSWELPIGVQRLLASSQIQSSHSGSGPSLLSAGDLLGGSTTDLPSLTTTTAATAADEKADHRPFDALIAIGVLIKGDTMHFEYISESVAQGLMRVQLDTGVPVVFGVLTVLTEAQARSRAGVGEGAAAGHNHGEDWGLAAVEMGVKGRMWAAGKMTEQ